VHAFIIKPYDICIAARSASASRVFLLRCCRPTSIPAHHLHIFACISCSIFVEVCLVGDSDCGDAGRSRWAAASNDHSTTSNNLTDV
jgi:hypothetical protein